MTSALTRRGMLATAGAAALAAPVVAPVVAQAGAPSARLAALLPVLPADLPPGTASALAAVEPDAGLIQACTTYIATMKAYDRDGGYLDCDADPLWAEWVAAEKAVLAHVPRTLAGVRALAEVALYKATMPDGRRDCSDSFTGQFPGLIFLAVLALVPSHGPSLAAEGR